MIAKRGDLAVVVRTQRDFYQDRPTVTRTEVTFGVVTSITRDGVAKSFRDAWDHVGPVKLYGNETVYIVPRVETDVDAAMRTAREHVFPNSDTPMPFGSLDEAKDVLRPLRRESAPA